MTEVIKIQPKCYFITPEHASSFWGKYVYLYSGQGRLQLTSERLVFESKNMSFDVPIQAIRNISVHVFSRWAKPFGLTYISLHFVQKGKEKDRHLVPVETSFSPTWKTSKIVENCIAAFSQTGELSSLIKLPIPKVTPPTVMQIALFFCSISVEYGNSFSTIQILRFLR
ncbi:MAG: hypothetical protein IPL71_21755 [Anaerolineales bacterium]|uniref:hypothetical protein n=1 Tax=Candidatus Villigracilis proximus TaxID=3140683 RepID=UPI003136A112|nr:hypothetical protein [Anaerolineales bacterium]